MNQTPKSEPTGPQRSGDRSDNLSSDDLSSEVSLRDLYLTLLRGLPLILILALVAGGGAYILNARSQPVYSAESTVLVTPPPIQIQGDDTLTFSPANEISFQTYSTIARSQPVLRDAVSRLPGNPLSPNQLLGLGTLREVITSSGSAPEEVPLPLSVVHRVRNANPERAALLADLWAQSTLRAVRDSLFASLEPVNETTDREVARLQRDVEEVEGRVQTFAAQDNGTLLEAELEGLTRQLTDGRERQGQLVAEIAATRARIAELQNQLGGAGSSGPSPSALGTEGSSLDPSLLAVLSAEQAVDAAETGMRARPRFTPSAQLRRTFGAALSESDTLSELLQDSEDEFIGLANTLYTEAVSNVEGALAEQQQLAQAAARAQAQEALELALLGYASSQTRAVQTQTAQVQAQSQSQAPAQNPSQDALTLLSGAELRREQVALTGLLAEQESLSAELTSYTRSAAALQQQLATLDQRRDRLDRELESVLSSYNTVAELQSSVSYLTELAPTNARLLSSASVPTAPIGPRRTFNTLLSAVLGGLAGVVLVFLSAAVRRPTSSRKALS